MSERHCSPRQTGVTWARNRRAERISIFRLVSAVIAYLSLGVITLSPLLWASVPPLVDYPNHLARMAILAHVGNPAIAENYVSDWHLLPNLAMDIVVPALAHLLPLECAGRVFIAATMALLVIGTVMLRRALQGSVGIWPICSFLFIYNIVLWYGFLNYLFALGVAIIGFAGWVSTTRWNPIWRLSLFSAVASVLFVLHLFALGVFGLLVIAFEAGEFFRTRGSSRVTQQASLIVGVFIPAGLMWLMSIGHGGPTYVAYGGLNDRIVAFIAPVSFNDPPTLFDFSLFVLAMVAIIVGFWSRSISIIPPMRVPLCALLLASVLMPEWVQGSWAASFRLPIVLPFLFFASLDIDNVQSRAVTRAAVLIAATLLCVRIWTVSETWRYLDHQFSEFRSALRSVPAGVRLFTVHGPMPNSAKNINKVPLALQELDPANYAYLSTLAVIDRGVFIPGLFTGWYPVKASVANSGLSRVMTLVTPEDLPKLASLNVASGKSLPRNVLGELPCCLDWPRTYQFVIWIDFGHVPNRLPSNLESWAAGSFFHIYRVTASAPDLRTHNLSNRSLGTTGAH